MQNYEKLTEDIRSDLTKIFSERNEVVTEEGTGQSTLNDNLQGDISRIDVKVLFDLYELIGTLGSSNTVSALNGLVDNKIELGTNLIKAIRVLEELKQDLGREKR
jgi:hypothetical protein